MVDINVSELVITISTACAGLSALFSWVVSIRMNSTVKRQILLDIFERFYAKKENRKITGYLGCVPDKFWVDATTPEIIESSNKLTSLDIDDYLGYIEILGGLVRRKAVDFFEVYDSFSFYVTLAWEHKGIQEFIKNGRDIYSGDIYEQFEYLYHKLDRYFKIKHNGGFKQFKFKVQYFITRSF